MKPRAVTASCLGMLRNRLRVAASLVQNQDPGSGTGIDVHRVVAGAVARNDQQLRTASNQAWRSVEWWCKLATCCTDLKCVGRSKDGFYDRIWRFVFKLGQLDTRRSL